MKTAVTLKKDQVYLMLKKLIVDGKLAPSEKLPREVDLAKAHGVGQVTLRVALSKLEEDGLIKRVHGRGTFVTPRSEKRGTEKTIMVIHSSTTGFEAPWHYIAPEISHFAEKLSLKTFVTTNDAIEMHSAQTVKAFIDNNNIIGIILTMNHFNGDESIIDKLGNIDVPIIIAHARRNDSQNTGFTSIVVDEKSGWETAISHLVAQGHSDIAIIGNKTSNPFRDNSKAETIQLLKLNGINPAPHLVCQIDFDKSAIINIVKELMNSSPRPTAILCYSDFYAIYVYEALAQLKLTIPDDVAVMGICGFPDAKFLSPPLSTIDYEYAEIGKMAVEMIMEPKKWFDAKTGKEKLRMKPFQLRARKSTEKTKQKEKKTIMDYSIQHAEQLVFA
ncbi:MAG: substrate-binding domain-containing protein [Victivallaceae bacterium]|nr:substrate-binding domain-containing protein [Victivallaceae bacterium]